MRRTGRTTKLRVEAALELLERGFTYFKDHEGSSFDNFAIKSNVNSIQDILVAALEQPRLRITLHTHRMPDNAFYIIFQK